MFNKKEDFLFQLLFFVQIAIKFQKYRCPKKQAPNANFGTYRSAT